ncbi:MAG: hypothetical protein DI568_08925 [Sphingomonas sp.]|nr:MAG: hypothetical protein DI568_08925 [Sphingomonas sp.]
MIGVLNDETGELSLFDDALWDAVSNTYPMEGRTMIDVPAALEGLAWSPVARAFGPAPRMLTSTQILGLYTTAQHARARRMLMAVYPEGHPWAGQLIDPDGLTQRLVDATLTLSEPMSTADPFHQNGTAWMRAVGVIESDEEAARIAAGITPEEAAL